MTMRTIVPMTIRGRYKGAIVEGAPPVFDIPAVADFVMETGISINEADLLYYGARSVALSGSETLVLSNGSLKDPLGAALTFIKIKAICVRVAALAPSGLIIGNAAATPFLGPLAGTAPTYTVAPGGLWIAMTPALAGWSAASGVSDQLKFANAGSIGPVNYDLMLVGTSA
jgi:hypothetical protein